MKLICYLASFLISHQIFPQNKTSEIDSLVSTYTSLNLFNGNILVIKDGKTIYNATHQINNSSSNKINSKTIFPIGSLTKSFTALVILKLQEEQKLSIEDQLSKYLPEYPNGEKIHLKHLLSHSSGVYESYRNPKYFDASTGKKNISPIEKMNFFKNEPLDFNPGDDFGYSNSGYDLLGIIIEKVTDLSYEEAIKKYVLKPLKMKNSGYQYENVKQNKTIGYSYLSKNIKKEAKVCNGTYLYASGGLYSTLEDLKKFYYGLLNHKIISKKSFELATTVQNKYYGYGWFIDKIDQDKIINHGGNIEGFTSYFMINIEKNICIIALNNITSNSLERIGNSIYKIITNKPYALPKPKKEIFLKEEFLKQYIGNYEISSDYFVNLSIKNGLLYLKINKEEPLKLNAESDKQFYIQEENITIEFVQDGNDTKIKIREGLSTKIGNKV